MQPGKSWFYRKLLRKLLLLSACALAFALPIADAAVAPNFTIVNHKTGQPLSLHDYQGSVILLDFWAYWCGFCQEAAADMEPNIVQYYQNAGGNKYGVPVTVISISIDLSDPAAEDNFIQTYGLQLVGDDPNEVAFAPYDQGYIPHFVVINGLTNSANTGAWQVLFSGYDYSAPVLKSWIDSVQSSQGQPKGSLQVTISPAAAITAGASWQVDGGAWQNSGATVSNLLAGNHSVSFSAISGWTTPTNQTVSVSANLTAAASGSYVALPQTLFTFTTNSGTITITGYKGSVGAAAIPAAIYGLPVTGIGDNAFEGCTSLTSITIPASVGSIGQYALDDCGSLTAITVDSRNMYYSSVNGVLFDKGKTTLVQFPGGVGGSYTLPDSVTSIGDYAFQDCQELTSVTIPGGVSKIGNEAFFVCTSLTGVYFGGNAPCIGSYVFLYDDHATVYYEAATSGWGSLYGGLPAVMLNPPIPAGSLQVSISPDGAVTAGAQWQVDGGTPQAGGAIVLGLSVGNHTVSFGTLNGWTIPSNQTVFVSGNSIATASGTYVAPTGSLQVTISPAGAKTAGAKWQLDGGTPQAGGVTVTNLLVGKHTVSFSTISGWTTPTNLTVSVNANSTATANAAYVQQFGSLQVTISPASAITAGAKWQVDGGTLQSSGSTLGNLSVGNHVVSFSTVSGWMTPTNQIISVSFNSRAAASGIYVLIGSLQVTIGPPAAIVAGAQWEVDGGSMQNCGTTACNLSACDHTVSFSTVSGWAAPSNEVVSIKAKSVTKIKGTYTFIPQGIYNGLFYPASGATEETAGMLSSLNVTAAGTYSGKLLIGGSTNAISGGFNVSGQASNHVQRTAKQGGALTLEMTLDWNESPPIITGTVSGTNGGSWTANLTNELAVKRPGSAEYTALMLPDGTPPGYGYMLVTNHAGVVTLCVTLADGASFSQAVPLSGGGDMPVYGNLYGGTGLLLGWIGLESGSPNGNLTWIKKASRSSARYANGFTNEVIVQGSLWISPSLHTAAIDLPFGQLDISGGNLSLPLSFNVAVSNNNTLMKLPASPVNSLTGSINPKTGLLTITFGNGAGKPATTAKGAVLQNVTNAGGFFLGKTNSGSLFLQTQ